MVFSSHIFIFWFLPLALIVYYILRERGRNLWLTLISYLFYGWANPWFVFLMLLSTCIDYCCGLTMLGHERGQRQKVALIISIVSNLSILAFFKYANFGIDNWNALIIRFLSDDTFLIPSLKIVLPLGISFYTFQSMSYAIDVYRKDAKATKSFIDFACYVSMFPQLVAGPIIRYQLVADQLDGRTYTYAKFARGVAFFILGCGQKILLANPCGMMADWAFDTPGRLCADAWIGLIAYSFQIFFDFAGYSNMAIGLGLMLGFEFPENFDFPYKSLSITEFWRRWHISLSTWLKDYLYIPLGGNRKGITRTYINLMLVMLLGGFWHGASWNFLIWGGIHGSFLVLERILRNHNLELKTLKPLKWGYCYFVVIIAWVFFRAPSISDATGYFGSLFSCGKASEVSPIIESVIYTPYHIISLALAATIAFAAPGAFQWTQRISTAKWIMAFTLFVLCIMALTTQSYNPFIYFIF